MSTIPGKEVPAGILATVLCLFAAVAPAQDLKELSRQARESVVLLRVYDRAGREVGNGTGFGVGDGRLVTNYHVIDRASRVEAVLADGGSVEVGTVLAVDEENDLAVVSVAAGRLPELPLAVAGQVEAGERVVVLGNPLGLSGTISEGIVSAVRSEGLGAESGGPETPPLLQITAPISPGSSGSPVINFGGEVVGVAVSQLLYGQNLNFAVPVAAVHELLARARDGAPVRTFGGGTRRLPGFGYALNIGLSVLFFAALFLGFRKLR